MWNTILCNVFLRNMRIAQASDPETSLGRRATHASLSEAEKYLAAKGQNAYMELAVKATWAGSCLTIRQAGNTLLRSFLSTLGQNDQSSERWSENHIFDGARLHKTKIEFEIELDWLWHWFGMRARAVVHNF